MSEAAKIILELTRYANRNNISLRDIIPQLLVCFHISQEEVEEIREILKADIREINASYSGYEAVNARLSRMSPDNPERL